MPVRTITIDGCAWEVFPSGRVTQSDHDEFSIVFRRRAADVATPDEVRITRYSPQGSRARAASLAELGAAELARLFALSQPGETSPELGYTR
jgi:hypothetical protein